MSHPDSSIEHRRLSTSDTSSDLQPKHGPLNRDSDSEPAVSDSHRPFEKTTPPAQLKESSRHAEGAASPNYNILRRNYGAIVVLLLYLPFLLAPWILTAVLSFRPLYNLTYIDCGMNFKPHDIDQQASAMRAIRVLTSIGAVLTIPVTTSLLAQAVVVLTQHSSAKSARALSFQQMLALADKAWSNALFWFEGSLTGKRGKNGGQKIHPYVLSLGPRTAAVSRTLVAALALVILVSVQQPLQQLLVTFETFSIPTCLDGPYVISGSTCLGDSSATWDAGNARLLGLDVKPENFLEATQDIYSGHVAEKLASFTTLDPQPNLWRDDGTLGRQTSPDFEPLNTLKPYLYPEGQSNLGASTFFAASLPYGTSTGVLRSAILRANSSVSCSYTSRSDFPAQCPGALPFTALFDSPNGLSVRVCVPGNYTSSPWSNLPLRTDISEELWFDLYVASSRDVFLAGYNGFDELLANTTMHCVVDSTMGYFILPNDQNGNTASKLLPSRPDFYPIWSDLYPLAYSVFNNNDPPPSPYDTVANGYTQAPGPLTIAALAMFGNSTWFGDAAQAVQSTNQSQLASLADWNLCQNTARPLISSGILENYNDNAFRYVDISSRCNATGFMSFDSSNIDHEQFINVDVYRWAFSFSNNSKDAQIALEVATYLSNTALLMQSATLSQDGEPIYTSPGIAISKPSVSLAGVIVISALIALQVMALACVAFYASRTPVWTSSLDALALIRLGSKLETDQLPVPRPRTRTDLEPLDKLSGTVKFELTDSARGQIQPTLGEGMAVQDIRQMGLSEEKSAK